MFSAQTGSSRPSDVVLSIARHTALLGFRNTHVQPDKLDVVMEMTTRVDLLCVTSVFPNFALRMPAEAGPSCV